MPLVIVWSKVCSFEKLLLLLSSYVQPAGRMRKIKGFLRPSLGFRSSKSILHTSNLSLFW